jgi:hypothetical protein
MRSWTKADMQSASLPLPDEVESLLSADTDRKTTSQLWAAFSTCYATEEDAIAAAKRNTGTILPYLNAPTNIYGSFAYMVEELGVDAAREVCKQNPGVLQCDPRAICQTSGEDIARAAKFVDAIEGLKLPAGVRMAAPPYCFGPIPHFGLIRLLFTLWQVRNNLDKVLFFSGAGFVAKRLLVDCVDRACGGAPLS